MPHLFVNRPRQFNLMSDYPAGYKHFDWEAANAILYLLGGLAFILGSIFFLPKYEALLDVGVWMFFGGSLLYLIVTVHDWLESFSYFSSHPSKVSIWDRLEFWAANAYVIGTLLFIVGTILFFSQIDLIIDGALCFIVGSLFFLAGACFNVMQITQAGSMFTLQLQNATGITFIVGSVLFLVASIPYLWEIWNPQDQQVLFTYAGWEFIVGSILFFMGGVFNFYRAYEAIRHYRQVAMQQTH